MTNLHPVCIHFHGKSERPAEDVLEPEGPSSHKLHLSGVLNLVLKQCFISRTGGMHKDQLLIDGAGTGPKTPSCADDFHNLSHRRVCSRHLNRVDVADSEYWEYIKRTV